LGIGDLGFGVVGGWGRAHNPQPPTPPPPPQKKKIINLFYFYL